MNKLYFGDNLDVLTRHIKDDSVDLIYLDPPFNSNANYNVLFKENEIVPSEAQAEAFRDTWSWGQSAEIAYEEVQKIGGEVALLLSALKTWHGKNGFLAYLAMMTIRLLELRRVLKSTGSLYLHCDPVACHYLKMILDAIFSPTSFGNELIWQRTNAKGLAFTRFARNHDTILRYTKSDKWIWNPQYTEHDPKYVEKFYRYEEAGTGRRYRLADLTNPNKNRPNLTYEFLGVKRVWRWTRERMQAAYDAGIVLQSKPGGVPALKRYLDEQEGNPVGDVWTDISPVQAQAQERLGYPTQKPLALLERIIKASSNEGDVVLDPFCGCGTTVEAAQKLNRQWIGIDVTHYAITLIERRLKKNFPEIAPEVHGRPADLAGAADLARRDKYQFQWWAAWLLGAQTYETKKGADRGIDGNIYFANGPYGHGRIIISVKGGENVSPVMVRELSGVVQREDAEMGILVTLTEPTRAMLADAAGAGSVKKSAHGRLPCIQIATIADLLAGKLPILPVPAPAKQNARRKGKETAQLELMLPFEGGKMTTKEGAIIDPRYLKLVSG